MKSYIYTITATPQKNCPAQNELDIKIYQIQNNIPEFIGLVKKNSGAYRGKETEIVQFLVDNGHLSANNIKVGYVNPDHRESFILNRV